MCIFSHDVQQVSNTKIYARLNGDRQHLVYEMRLTSESDVAMILPLPTQLPSTDQVSFVNLSGYDFAFQRMFGNSCRFTVTLVLPSFSFDLETCGSIPWHCRLGRGIQRPFSSRLPTSMMEAFIPWRNSITPFTHRRSVPITSESDVAMILPLPTQLPSTDQVSFVNLSG